jgi:voltage-gated potassium channel
MPDSPDPQLPRPSATPTPPPSSIGPPAGSSPNFHPPRERRFPPLREIVEERDTRSGQIFDLAVQALIAVSLITYSLETLPGLSPSMLRLLNWAEVGIVLLFTLEYGLRIYTAPRKLAFIFSFFGLVDLLAILPFYLATTLDLRTIRAFRLLRLFRTLKIVRYNRAIQRFHRALLIAREEIILFGMVAILLLYLSAVGIHHFEHEAQPEAFASVFHALWWSVCTLTTVGYGDVFPITPGGKFFTSIVLVIGLGIVAVPAGLVASALSKSRELEEEQDKTQEEAREKVEEKPQY